MDDNKILKLVYTFFLGLLIAVFVGVGINTFYPGPKIPEYPTSLSTPVSKEVADKETAAQRNYDAQYKKYTEAVKPYNRNVSIVILVAAVVLLTVSILTEKKMRIISDGVMLGGLFTLVYSIGRSFASSDSKYVFLVTSVGLVIVMYLGYHRFVRPHAVK